VCFASFAAVVEIINLTGDTHPIHFHIKCALH
jgi:hypothetical protein